MRSNLFQFSDASVTIVLSFVSEGHSSALPVVETGVEGENVVVQKHVAPVRRVRRELFVCYVCRGC